MSCGPLTLPCSSRSTMTTSAEADGSFHDFRAVSEHFEQFDLRLELSRLRTCWLYLRNVFRRRAVG